MEKKGQNFGAKFRSEAKWNESVATIFAIQACTYFVVGQMIGWGVRG